MEYTNEDVYLVRDIKQGTLYTLKFPSQYLMCDGNGKLVKTRYGCYVAKVPICSKHSDLTGVRKKIYINPKYTKIDNGVVETTILSKSQASVLGSIDTNVVTKELNSGHIDLNDEIEKSCNLIFPSNWLRCKNDSNCFYKTRYGDYQAFLPVNDGAYQPVYIKPQNLTVYDNGIARATIHTRNAGQISTLNNLDLHIIDAFCDTICQGELSQNKNNEHRMTNQREAGQISEDSNVNISSKYKVSKEVARRVIDEKNVRDVVIFNSMQGDYNELIEFANKHNITLDERSLYKHDPDMKLDAMLLRMNHSRNAVYIQLRNYCDSNFVTDSVPDISMNKHMSVYIPNHKSKNQQYDSLDIGSKTEQFNAERGLSLYGSDGTLKTCTYGDKTFIASYCGYALSEYEQQQLSKGESIILSEVNSDDNTCLLNVKCKLEKLPETESGSNYGIVVCGYENITSKAFQSETHNEKYRMHRESFDAAVAYLASKDAFYHDRCVEQIERNKRKSVGVDTLEQIMNAKATAAKDNGWSKGSLLHKENRFHKPVNYFVESYIDMSSQADVVIIKHRNPYLLQATKERLLREPPSKKGHELYGFETRYDELQFENSFKSRKNIYERLKSALEYAQQQGRSEYETRDLHRAHDVYKTLYEELQMQRDWRQQPVEDKSLSEIGIKNKWEEYVHKEHERLKNEPPDSRSERFKRYNERLDKVLAMRKETKQNKAIDGLDSGVNGP